MEFPKEVLEALKEESVTFAAQTKKGLVTSREKGITPMMRLLLADRNALQGAYVADRVIGKAAAFLALYGGAAALYGELMSEHARGLLERQGLPCFSGKTVPYIRNRRGDGMCPMEATVLETEEIDEAFERLRNKWCSMQK